jgi:hypothetical protein
MGDTTGAVGATVSTVQEYVVVAGLPLAFAFRANVWARSVRALYDLGEVHVEYVPPSRLQVYAVPAARDHVKAAVVLFVTGLGLVAMTGAGVRGGFAANAVPVAPRTRAAGSTRAAVRVARRRTFTVVPPEAAT